jgi:uncharacterized protein (DUF362 family)
MIDMDSAVVVPFKEDYERTVFKLMDRLEVAPLLAEQSLVLLKPNLVTSSPPPVTTDVAMVAAVAKWCREVTSATIVVVEGSGEGETQKNFSHLGYRKVPADEFVDLDREEIAEYAHPEAERFPKIWLPQLVTEGFLISIPVLKDHSIAKVTLSIKNMVGALPTSHYRGSWSFKKSAVHDGDLDQAIADLARYRPPDLALVDGRIGMKGSHLSGMPCSPPKRVLIGGRNPWAVDAKGAWILGWSWEQISHLVATRHLFCDGEEASGFPPARE